MYTVAYTMKDWTQEGDKFLSVPLVLANRKSIVIPTIKAIVQEAKALPVPEGYEILGVRKDGEWFRKL